MSTKLSKARKELTKVSPDFSKLINKLDLKAIKQINDLTKNLKQEISKEDEHTAINHFSK